MPDCSERTDVEAGKLVLVTNCAQEEVESQNVTGALLPAQVDGFFG